VTDYPKEESMRQIVPPRAAVLADFPDFHDPRGVRHPLRAVPLLSYVAMLSGARRSVWPASTAQPTSPLLVVAMLPNPLVCSR